MKQLIIALSIASILAVAGTGVNVEANPIQEEVVTADDDKKLLKKVRDSYLMALNSGNSGLVESAIFNSLMLSVKYPEFDIRPIKSRLKKLAIEGESHIIRYKAYLGITFLENRDAFEGAEELASLLDYEDPNKFFGYLDKKIKNNLLTIKR